MYRHQILAAAFAAALLASSIAAADPAAGSSSSDAADGPGSSAVAGPPRSQRSTTESAVASQASARSPATGESVGPTHLKLYRALVPVDPGRRRFVPADWMYASLEFRGHGLVGYLNLTVDAAWVIRNVPVVAALDGLPEVRWFAFAPNGEVARSAGAVSYGVAIEPVVRETAPMPEDSATPASQPVVMCGIDGLAGEGGGPAGGPGHGPTGSGAAVPLIGDELAEKPVVHQGKFPNQPAKVNQCVTVAFSNSLEWIQSTQGLDTAPVDLTPGYIDHELGRKDDQPVDVNDAIAKKKARYGELVDTIVFDGKNGLPMPRIQEKLRQNCDLEMFVKPAKPGAVGHMVAIVSITRTKDGNWSIDVAHDIRQGPTNNDYQPTDPDGDHKTVTQTYVYGSNDHLLSGDPPELRGREVGPLVAECKKERKPAR